MDDSLALPPLRRPNVLWIFGDQHRAQATGYRGDPNVATPNLDNLGRQGVRFDCAVVPRRSSIANSLPRGAGRNACRGARRARSMATGPAGCHCAAVCSAPGG